MILITRPLNEAKLLAKELKTFSLPTIIEPLTSFEYYKKRITFHEKIFFIVSSLQSVHVLQIYQKNYQNIIAQGKFLVVGMKVAAELRSLGVNKIIKQFNSSDSLFNYLLRKKKSFEFKIEYLCGSIVNDDFIIGLKRSRIKHKKVVLYKTIAVKKLSVRCSTSLKNNQITIVLIYSAYTAKVFMKLLRQYKLLSVLKNTYVLCLSKRIAYTFKDTVPQKKLLWSRSSNQKSLLDSLKSVIKQV